MKQPRRAAHHAVLWASLLLGSALSPPATAATATEEGARAVERELHDWMQGLLGGAFAPDRPVQLTPEGGDYALVVPLGTASAITGHLTPQDDGRWRLTGLKIPSPSTFTLTVPTPARDGQAPASAERTYQFSVARQETTGLLDPSYKTASSLQQRFETLQITSSGGGFKQASQVARTAGQTTLTPAADGRFDLASSSTFDGYLVDNQEDGGFTIHMTADHGRAAAQLGGISPDKGPAVLRNAVSFVTRTLADVTIADGKPERLTPEQQERLRAGFRALVEALNGFASTMQTDYAIEGVQVQAGGFTGIARRATLGLGGGAPEGVLNLYLDFGLEGLSIPGMLAALGVPAQYSDLVPTDLHLRPTLAGIGTKELLDQARRWLDMPAGGTPPTPDPAPLFARGGVAAGLDAVSFNLGPTKFAGRGAVTFAAPSPDAFTGQGQVTATNFDALLDRAKRDPGLRQGLAALTFAKGIGRASGDQLVWDITWRDGTTLVNGVDVMAMAGGAGGDGGKRRAGPPPEPAPAAPAPAPRAPSRKPPPM